MIIMMIIGGVWNGSELCGMGLALRNGIGLALVSGSRKDPFRIC